MCFYINESISVFFFIVAKKVRQKQSDVNLKSIFHLYGWQIRGESGLLNFTQFRKQIMIEIGI